MEIALILILLFMVKVVVFALGVHFGRFVEHRRSEEQTERVAGYCFCKSCRKKGVECCCSDYEDFMRELKVELGRDIPGTEG